MIFGYSNIKLDLKPLIMIKIPCERNESKSKDFLKKSMALQTTNFDFQ